MCHTRIISLLMLLALTRTSRAQDTLRIDTRDLSPDIVYQLITPDDSIVVTPVDGHIEVPITDTTQATYRLSAASASAENDVTIQFTHDAGGIGNVTVITNDTVAPMDSSLFDVRGGHTILLYDGPERRPDLGTPPYHLLLKSGMLITPNGDGDHDEFRITFNVPVTAYALTIISRSGQQVFHSTDPTQAWNGKLNNTGAALPTGAYRYTLLLNGITDTGKFILER